MTEKSLLLILGNQLFPVESIQRAGTNFVFMAEDLGLCTYEKHHKLKILMFLAAMREKRDELLALDGEVLAAMADMLGFSRDFTNLSDRTRQHKGRIQEWLWDDDRSVFANRLVNGKFVDALAPTSFFPMVAGAATAGQVEALVTQYLKPANKFGGKYTLPSAARDQPAYKDNMYWRGRVWAPLNFWVHQGLLRYERQNDAEDLAHKSRSMFQAHWDNRHCSENYSAIDGDINDQADTDHFYTWGALLPALSLFNLLFEGR